MYGFELSRAIEEVVERPKTTSYVDVSDILGRDNVKDDLVSIILGKGTKKEKCPRVISLVGMGDYAMWKPFGDALKSCGSQSSRILVTTHKDKVAKMMKSTSTIKLEELFEEDCWSVLSKIAFFDKDPKQCEQLENLGRQISKKCKGLPLVAKTLGNLMQFKKSREEWQNVLDSNLWELEDVERGPFTTTKCIFSNEKIRH
ncbi:putative disease resistance protein RGA3 [Quercus suber]|uniref:putative disease resistance protein RGA3 n=1 Tax=Quercus suber TaxID=58331 RepID=UPI0032E0270C